MKALILSLIESRSRLGGARGSSGHVRHVREGVITPPGSRSRWQAYRRGLLPYQHPSRTTPGPDADADAPLLAQSLQVPIRTISAPGDEAIQSFCQVDPLPRKLHGRPRLSFTASLNQNTPVQAGVRFAPVSATRTAHRTPHTAHRTPHTAHLRGARRSRGQRDGLGETVEGLTVGGRCVDGVAPGDTGLLGHEAATTFELVGLAVVQGHPGVGDATSVELGGALGVGRDRRGNISRGAGRGLTADGHHLDADFVSARVAGRAFRSGLAGVERGEPIGVRDVEWPGRGGRRGRDVGRGAEGDNPAGGWVRGDVEGRPGRGNVVENRSLDVARAAGRNSAHWGRRETCRQVNGLTQFLRGKPGRTRRRS
jgi:hypothetical protein